jgi:methyl-accepting chemotaxis protein
MDRSQGNTVSYMRKIFFITYLIGLFAGGIFPLIASPIVGATAYTLPFIVLCLLMGLAVGSLIYFFVQFTLKRQLRRQIDLLRPLAGEVASGGETTEDLQRVVEESVSQAESFIRKVFQTVDQLIPHYRSLADSSRYLSDRAHDGLAAAHRTRGDVESMEKKQQDVMTQLQALSHRSQDEAALSRELSASLEEMSAAMEHSTAKFLETTTTVDEMAGSIREVASQAEDIAHSVEGTAHNLDAIGESLERIREGAFAGAKTAEAVKKDAESGLQVVKASINEMERIDQESLKANEAMKRLSVQTGEVAKIIEVIKELVSDTELLAFNAAIIAAKAGDEGKGFSVVAEEIRDLADRTTASAQDIHRIVKAIGGDTKEVTEAVETTAMRIAKGKQLSLSTGEALRKIAESSSQSAGASKEIAELTRAQGDRARSLLEEAGHSLGSVKAIARAMQEQQFAINRIQEGVTEMKAAADQVARGMEEQVRATREFDKGLAEREEQVLAINEATSFQLETSQRVFSHFAVSEQRLTKNAERASVISREIVQLEQLAERLKEQTLSYENRGRESSAREAATAPA